MRRRQVARFIDDSILTVAQIYGLRFLIGFFEATCWPGYNTIISAWYLPHELATRLTIYNCAQAVGGMLSGALQGAISTNLDGHLGRTGWQWAFLVNVSHALTIRALLI
jgi:ACS family pantothenate transporter-like MFS transporter